MNSYERIYTALTETIAPSRTQIIKAQKGLTPKQISVMNRAMTTKTKEGDWRTLDQAKEKAVK